MDFVSQRFKVCHRIHWDFYKFIYILSVFSFWRKLPWTTRKVWFNRIYWKFILDWRKLLCLLFNHWLRIFYLNFLWFNLYFHIFFILILCNLLFKFTFPFSLWLLRCCRA